MSYIKPIPLEELPYTPVELGEMLENDEKEREIEVEGYGKGRLVISKQNKNKPFFYADEANIPANQKAAKQLQVAETAFNAPLLLSPLLGLASGIPKIAKDRTRAQIKKARMSADESNLDGAINLKQNVDGVFNMPSQQVRDIVRIAKKNKISYKQAEEYLNLKLRGTEPKGTLNPGSGRNDPTVYIPPDERIGTQKGDPLMIDLGIESFGVRKKVSIQDYRNKLFNEAGFRKNENGNFVFDLDSLLKFQKGERRRLTSQVAQTKTGQTVRASFEKTRAATLPEFAETYGGYMQLTGSKPNLHHEFAAMVSAPLYDGVELSETPGSEWMQLTELLNNNNIFPGSPVTDPSSLGGAKSNLRQLVTKGRKGAPPEPHDILHHLFYKEMGIQDIEKGQATFWTRRKYKMNTVEGRLQVAQEYADIVNEGNRLITEAMSQINALFGKNTDPQKITDLLMELADTGKLKITGTKYRLKSVESIVKIIKDEVKANLPLADEQEVLNTVAQYKLDYDQEIEAIDLLHNIADYNESMRVFGKRPPSITAKQHKQNIDRYMNLIQTKLPLEIPVEAAKKEGLKTYTYKRVKPLPIENQLELLFPEPND